MSVVYLAEEPPRASFCSQGAASANSGHARCRAVSGEVRGVRKQADSPSRYSARNALKHLDAGGSPTVTLDVREEAVDILNRAMLPNPHAAVGRGTQKLRATQIAVGGRRTVEFGSCGHSTRS
jgi:hypothetical protein